LNFFNSAARQEQVRNKKAKSQNIFEEVNSLNTFEKERVVGDYY